MGRSSSSASSQCIKQCIKQCLDHHPEPRSGLCPSCWPIFGFRNLLGGREREPRRAGEASPKPPPKPPPKPRSGLCPELLADFRIPKPPGCSQGAQRAVFCAVRVADFLAEGRGWGASPGRAGELRCLEALRRCLKKL